MAHPEQDRQPTADAEQVSVDTHQDLHVAAVITAVGGVPVADASFPSTAGRLPPAAGLGPHLRRAAPRRGGRHRLIWGCPDPIFAPPPGHRRRGQPAQPGRGRRHGKTDTADAIAAAGAVLSQRASVTAKAADGPVEMLRMFRLARASAVKHRHPGRSTNSRPSSSPPTQPCATPWPA